MRYLTATQIHNGYGFLPADTALMLEEDGRIEGLIALDEIAEVPSRLEVYEGILCPSFINAHCHLELSHLYRRVPEQTGLVGFVSRIPQVRKEDNPVLIAEAIITAARQMYDNGIVAVGDISNTTDTLGVRAQLPLHLHTFVECMGVVPQFAQKRLEASEEVYNAYRMQKDHVPYLRRASLVPHAPYSVSPPLLQMIAERSGEGVVSVHNQESQAENLFFADKSGDLRLLYQALQVDPDRLELPVTSSLAYVVSALPAATPLVLVHNTFMSKADIRYLQEARPHSTLCLCPNANWYIERALPDIPMLLESGLSICLGTDSLASNYGLDIYAEILKVQQHYPDVGLDTLLQWATINGARALQMDDVIGSFDKGKRPGVNLIGADNKIIKLI